jgi:CRP-like cAMP-binding protein
MAVTEDELWSTPIFCGLDDAQRRYLRGVLRENAYESDASIITEGVMDPYVHIVRSGRAAILKNTASEQTQLLAHIEAGELVGEMKMAENRPASASVVAIGHVDVWTLNVDELTQSEIGRGIRTQIMLSLVELLSSRLRQLGGTAASAMKNELDQTRARVTAGTFAMSMLGLMAIYSIGTSILTRLDPSVRPSLNTTVAVGIVLLCLPILWMIRKSPYPLRSYGLTLARWPRVSVEALVYSLPILVVATLLKLLAMKTMPALRDTPLIDIRGVYAFGRHEFDLWLYIVLVVIYIVTTPAQEFFARSGLQASLDMLVPSDAKTNWTAIVGANLFFSSAHAYLSLEFAIATFIPGIFWGWLFQRQRSLVGVSVSHAVIGLWIFFVLNFRTVLNAL